MLDKVIASLKEGRMDVITNPVTVRTLNDVADGYIRGTRTKPIELNKLIQICNMVYNGCDMDWSPVTNSIYDRLMVIAKKLNPEGYQVGNVDIPLLKMDNTDNQMTFAWDMRQKVPFEWGDWRTELAGKADMFPELFEQSYLNYFDYRNTEKAGPNQFDENRVLPKRLRTVAHGNPELVGTLTKYKYVLEVDAIKAGVVNDPSVFILERDFFGKLITEGLISPYEVYEMLLSIKYDGVSVEVTVQDGCITGARSRGDTANDLATDMTPIFSGIQYPRAKGVNCDLKLEAVITNTNLNRLALDHGIVYKNARNGVAGLLARTDAPKYRKYISLVPLHAVYPGYDIPRAIEAELNNRHFCMDVPFNHLVIQGNYRSLLYQIKQYTELLNLRRLNPRYDMGFIFDGVVFEFTDKDLRKRLGRVNSVDQFAGAVKFDVDQEVTMFLGYRFEVGSTGKITPVAQFQPVEFLGNTIAEADCFSYEYFKRYNLAVGDMITVKYVNGVIPLIETISSEHNMRNHAMHGVFPFPKTCPVCGSPLTESESGKTMLCTNASCNGRMYKRLAYTMDKFGIKGIKYATIEKLNKFSTVETLADVFELTEKDWLDRGFGEGQTANNMRALADIKTKRMTDWAAIGNVGFTNVGQSAFKLILENMGVTKLLDLLEDPYNERMAISTLSSIRGIGEKTAKTIWGEYPIFKKSIRYILDNFTLTYTSGVDTRPKVVFTGCRPESISRFYEAAGYNASLNNKFNKSVALVIYGDENTSTVRKARAAGIKCISQDDVYIYLKK